MCQMCDDDGPQTCQYCSCLVCWDVSSGDDLIQPAMATSSGDLACARCAHRIADEEEGWDDCGEVDFDPYEPHDVC